MELGKDAKSRTSACGCFLEIYFSRVENVSFSKMLIITVLAEPGLRINSIIAQAELLPAHLMVIRIFENGNKAIFVYYSPVLVYDSLVT